MLDVLIIVAVFAYIAGIFAIRCFIGEKLFWGRRYRKQNDQILLSRRFDACLFDTFAVFFFSFFAWSLCFDETSAILSAGAAGAIICSLSVLMFLCARLLVKTGAFYDENGLLLSKPFKRPCAIPWDGIGSIQKRNQSAQIYNVLDKNGQRLVWFPLSRKTEPFLALAQQHGVDVHIPKGAQMVYSASGKKLNGTLAEWDAAFKQSAYAQNDILAAALFQDFAVALFMDRRLNEDNVIAINRDGTVRWKISDLIKQPAPASYAALSKKNAHVINVMAVASRQYDCKIYEIDVYKQRVIHQPSRRRAETADTAPAP